MSNEVKGDMWSVVSGSAVVTALTITVAIFIKSKSNALLLCFSCLTLKFYISTIGELLIAWLIVILTFVVVGLCNSSIDETL